MGVIVALGVAFGLTVSEVKTEIMCLRTKGMPQATTIYSYTSRGTSTTTLICPSRSIGAYATHGAASGSILSKCTTDRALSPRAQNMDAKSRRTRDNAVRLRYVEPASVPIRYAAPSPSQLPYSLHRLPID